MHNDGKDFEQLVESITKCLHRQARVAPNDKVVDVHTGRKRQIDITIRMKDGPTEFLAMIEVRDRSRKVGIEYVEQVKSKRDAIRADKAVIVSKRGFAQAALEKARFYNIETYSLTEALRANWSQMYAPFRGFSVTAPVYSVEDLAFIGESGGIINPREDLIQKVIEGDMAVVVIFNEDGSPRMSMGTFLHGILDNPQVAALANTDPNMRHPIKALSPLMQERMYLRDQDDKIVRVREVVLIGHVWKETKSYEPTVRQYRDEKTGEIIAEVIGANDPAFDFEVIAEYPERMNTERRTFLRMRPRPPAEAEPH